MPAPYQTVGCRATVASLARIEAVGGVAATLRPRIPALRTANATSAPALATRKLPCQPVHAATAGAANWPTAKPAGALMTKTPIAVPRLSPDTAPPIRFVDAVQIAPTPTPATSRAASSGRNSPARPTR